MPSPKIVAFAGSTRRESFNFALVSVAARFAEKAGAEVTLLHLKDYDLPLFNQDLESDSFPEAAKNLHGVLKSHDGFLIACPEYNSSITPLLKNTIDWCSRPFDGESSLSAFQGKVAGLLAASPGGLGGLRGLVHVRSILGNIGVHVIPEQAALAKAHEAFSEGELTNDSERDRVQGVAESLVETTRRLTQA